MKSASNQVTVSQSVASQPVKSASSYESKIPDSRGYIDYTAEENGTWKILYERQMKMIKNRACDEFINGLDILKMTPDAVPQLSEINEKLSRLTGWTVERVPALIGFERFFELLANRKFPAATFIRRREDLDYIKEPDIFHELFGHCPLLTNQNYADFSQHYGKLGLAANKQDRAMLARLYWFTIEFGLIKSNQGLKIYGGGILSSKEETCYSLESDIPKRRPLDVLEVFRTHYRIDELQKNYFIIEQLSDLQCLIDLDLNLLIQQAIKLGMKPSDHAPKENAAC
ncbi:phenylalanine 4-monooxygenase [Aliikangiella coralliicola]|uniref:Phenylalanine-4-hydroxylase n=1 Tax=Aliikangiella coralliicola TaxID=2592383 RepID=A0A545UA70_9GAMM|nr:phenylalanine 4-monooxygenase [Aliikangiella coralliicola]TQV86366.1 phenylalanine 4-monooxygenase [Aliikangiella coralliicola]